MRGNAPARQSLPYQSNARWFLVGRRSAEPQTKGFRGGMPPRLRIRPPGRQLRSATVGLASTKAASRNYNYFVKKTLFLMAIAGVWFAHWQLHGPITYPPGVLIASEPIQVDLPTNEPEFGFGEFHLKPLARFAVDARLLHSKIYRYDRGASLVPIDLAVGWGPMSDQQVLDHLHVSQSMRFFWYEYKMPPPIAAEQIVNHATNIHISPSTPELAARCKSLRSGALVHLSGELVQATGPQIGTWRSSLSRTDSGNGACELLYLEDLGLLSAEAVPNKSRLVQR
jgi:hypothetical protein